MKKKFAAALAATMLATSFTAVTTSADDEVKVTVNGSEFQFEDQGAIIQNGRTLVPLRALAEMFGATVEWDNDTRTVKIVFNNTAEVTTEATTEYTTTAVVKETTTKRTTRETTTEETTKQKISSSSSKEKTETTTSSSSSKSSSSRGRNSSSSETTTKSTSSDDFEGSISSNNYKNSDVKMSLTNNGDGWKIKNSSSNYVLLKDDNDVKAEIRYRSGYTLSKLDIPENEEDVEDLYSDVEVNDYTSGTYKGSTYVLFAFTYSDGAMARKYIQTSDGLYCLEIESEYEDDCEAIKSMADSFELR